MTQTRHPSVDRLLAAIRKSGEFPAMAKTVGLISSLTSSEATSSGALADTILQDYGLTQKVLRLVNTVAYAQYNEITTITRAVLLMGFERIRAIATGLLLFEHLQKQARTGPLVDTLNMSFFSAVLGRNIADNSGFADTEEAFICALFHRLGRLLVAFYLPEDYEVIQSAEDGKQDLRAREVLGLTFQEMGVAVADELGLPQKLSDSMVRVPGSESRRVLSPGERLGCVATLANDITDVLKVKLETIYRALGVGKTRVFFLLKDPSTSVAWFRFGFGQSAGEMKPWFEIPIRGAEDLFSLSFTHQKSGEKAGRASGRR